MFLAMNRFKIEKGKEQEFEKVWKERDTHLEGVKGFVKFNLLKGAETESYSLYASHSIWESREHFINWTKSEAFRLAHKNAGQHAEIYMGPPQLETFEKAV